MCTWTSERRKKRKKKWSRNKTNEDWNWRTKLWMIKIGIVSLVSFFFLSFFCVSVGWPSCRWTPCISAHTRAILEALSVQLARHTTYAMHTTAIEMLYVQIKMDAAPSIWESCRLPHGWCTLHTLHKIVRGTLDLFRYNLLKLNRWT